MRAFFISMDIYMKLKLKLNRIKFNRVMALIYFPYISNFAFAAGGFNSLTSMAESFRSWLYGFIAVLAGVTFIWAAYEGATGNMTWSEILKKCLWIIAAGGSIPLVAYIFYIGGQMVFK